MSRKMFLWYMSLSSWQTVARSILLLALTFFITWKFTFVDSQPYSRQELMRLSDQMLEEFHDLPTLDYEMQCANPTEDSAKNSFYKYVLNVKNELDSIGYADPDAFYIRNGYTFLQAWEDYGGWHCHAHLDCAPLPDHAIREADPTNWVIWYQCLCGTIVIDKGGIVTYYKSSPIDPNANPIQCRYDEPNSFCSSKKYEIFCHESDYVCLIDEFDVACNLDNEKNLESYLTDHNLVRRPDDCKCRHNSEEIPDWSLDQDWSTREYVLRDKPLVHYDKDCADIGGLIGDIRANYQSSSDSYRLPPAAKLDFDRLQADNKVAECDMGRELFCDFTIGPTPGRFGLCKCNAVPAQTGWSADTTNIINSDGYCALESGSDCSFGIRNYFQCQLPDVCVIQLCDVECTEANLEAVVKSSCIPYLEWKGNNTADSRPEDERFVKRCHCHSPAKVYPTFQERKQEIAKSAKKTPIFDLGYGSNLADSFSVKGPPFKFINILLHFLIYFR